MAQLQQYANILCIVNGSLLKQMTSVDVDIAEKNSRAGANQGEVIVTSAVPESGIECDLVPGDNCVLHIVLGTSVVKKFKAIVKKSKLEKHVSSSAIHTLVFKVEELEVDPDVVMLSKLLLQLHK